MRGGLRVNVGLVFPKMTFRDLKQAKRDYLIGGPRTPMENSPQQDLTPKPVLSRPRGYARAHSVDGFAVLQSLRSL